MDKKLLFIVPVFLAIFSNFSYALSIVYDGTDCSGQTSQSEIVVTGEENGSYTVISKGQLPTFSIKDTPKGCLDTKYNGYTKVIFEDGKGTKNAELAGLANFDGTNLVIVFNSFSSLIETDGTYNGFTHETTGATVVRLNNVTSITYFFKYSSDTGLFKLDHAFESINQFSSTAFSSGGKMNYSSDARSFTPSIYKSDINIEYRVVQ